MKFKIIFIAILTSISISCRDNRLLECQDIFNIQLKPWTATFVNFKLTDFKLQQKIPFDGNSKHDLKDLNLFHSIYRPILTFSPDSSSFIDIYSYQLNLTKKGEIFTAFPDVDQAIMLCNPKTNYWDRICFGAPGLYYEEAIWINNTEFFLLASIMTHGNKRTPLIFIGNLNTQELIRFENINLSCFRKTSGYKSDKLNRLKIEGL